MDDVHEFCVISRHLHRLDTNRVRFNREVRRFRRAHPWLVNDLGPTDIFDYLHPTNATVLFHGGRTGPKGERVLFVANMEGRTTEIIPADLPGGDGVAWTPMLVSPGVAEPSATARLTLGDAQGVVFTADAV